MQLLSKMQRLRRQATRLNARPSRTDAARLPPLADFVAQSPGLERPDHLVQLTDLFERIAAGETVKALIATPPQHGKSQTVLHGLVWLLSKLPAKRTAYATYAQTFSRDQSMLAHRVAENHGLSLGRSTLDRWVTPAGGGVVWTSRGGPLTGYAIDGVLIVDDLLKDREEANSSLIRKKAMGWLSSAAFTRMHPGASVVLIATRWHLDDPTGQLLQREGWEYVKLPAISPEGEALWPSHRPLSWLEEQRKQLLAADWSALYMCEPIAEGSQVFGPATTYPLLPEVPYREAHGFDAAYTAKTSADWTVTITGRLIEGRIYITNLIRQQAEPMTYIPLMRASGVQHVTWFRSGTERGLEELLKREGIRVTAIPATGDKLARAIGAATAWNRGEILLPAGAPWASIITSELSQFTGQEDAHDDIVDALAALHHALANPKRVTTAQTAQSLYR